VGARQPPETDANKAAARKACLFGNHPKQPADVVARCWRRRRSEPCAGLAASRLERTEVQARRRMQLVFPGSVASRQGAQIGAGVNTIDH
jgi:hypothetical protein